MHIVLHNKFNLERHCDNGFYLLYLFVKKRMSSEYGFKSNEILINDL